MFKANLAKLARDLYDLHGLMPVPVHGKVPLGGQGWNLLPLEVRLRHIGADECTGVGIQFGLVFHPVLGPVEARGLDCDIDDKQKSMLFAGHLQTYFQPTEWRWGRRPATIVFTQPGIIKQEKFGPVQLLGANKQAVWWGEYRNKVPAANDPREYWHEGTGILDLQPPYVLAATLQQALEASLAAAGIVDHKKSMLIEATPLSTADLAMLTLDNLALFQQEIKSMLSDVDNSPVGSGRGTKLFNLGLKYGALIKASGNAPMLTDAMYEVCSDVVAYEILKKHAFLAQIGEMADEAFASLPGSLGQGDRRDFARGVGVSKGLSQSVAVSKAKQHLPMPSGRGHPPQTVEDLLRKDLPDQKFLVDRFFTDSGCIILAGKPKVGKGWIMLELGLSIAEGSQFWNEQCQQAEVLMYMLEDGERRIQKRIKMLRPNGFNAGKNMKMRYSVDGPFYVNADGTGTLLQDIRANLQMFPGIRFIVVDVLQRIRGEIVKNDNAYERDYKIVGAIQKLATEFGVLIIIVHHTKKGKVDDAIDSISGSFGISGAADGSIVIGKQNDVMHIESQMRDITNFDFDLTKEGDNPMWKPAQTAAELFAPSEGTKTNSVLLALNAAACCLTAGDIAVRTGINEKNVATYLGRLLKSNSVTRPSRGFYMAIGLPYRERIKGVIDVLRRCPKTVATPEIKAQYAPNIAPLEASYMILTAVAIKEIEAGFVNGKDALQSLKIRGLATFNSDTVWLIGDDWGEYQQPMRSNPFAFKMPWE